MLNDLLKLAVTKVETKIAVGFLNRMSLRFIKVQYGELRKPLKNPETVSKTSYS